MRPPGAGENGIAPDPPQSPRRLRAVQPAEADPAPHTAKRPTHNLPLELSSFVGREREIAEVKELLADHRLLTLSGPGGCGKTRLALAVARDMVGEFEDGAWMVELASLADPGLVTQTVASTLGVREEPDRPLAEVLVDHLESKKLLLILDNCEHLVGACAQLAEALLRACPDLRILATSREVLEVSGEISWLVPPLSLPEPYHLPSIEKLLCYEAVRLFVERATAALSSFTLAQQNTRVVAEVCQKLDGMPLAIELAAARVRVLAVEQISERLDECFRLLRTDNRTAVLRQRTLRATMDWSHDLLSEEEKVLFRRLSVFAGGFTLEAAEKVCSAEGIEEDEVLDLLSHLVDQSLVLVTERHGEARYRLLETVRQYGKEKLNESREAQAIRDGHALFFLKLAEEAEPAMLGPEQEAWVGRLEQEHDNLRTALGWLKECGGADQGLRLAGALGRFWWFRGYYTEGRAQLEEFLGLAGAAPIRAKALSALGMLIYRSADYSAGDQEAALSRLEESLEIYRELGEERRLAAVLREIGRLSIEVGDWERARSFLEQSLKLEWQSGNEHGIAMTRTFLGMLALLTGERGLARSHLEESLGVLRELGGTNEIKKCLFFLGQLSCDEGDYAAARARFTEIMEGDTRQYRWAVPCVLESYARLAAEEGRPARALRLGGAAAMLYPAIGTTLGPAYLDYLQRGWESAWQMLSEEEGAAAYEEGKAMTLEVALTYALEEPPPEGPQHTRVAGVIKERAASGLSYRELEVLTLAAEGLTDAQVAERLYLSPRTVGQHLRSVYRKLGVSSRTAASREAARRGLI
jgi:predicted ATPase/DNA-binding CsgD family transcriptional regulator